MFEVKRTSTIPVILALAWLVCNVFSVLGQQKRVPQLKTDKPAPMNADLRRGGGDAVRSVTIPVTVRARGSKEARTDLQAAELTVQEDGDTQRILSVRAMNAATPLTLAILIQDDVVSQIANEINPLKDYIRRLPPNSRVFVGYIRSGSLDLRQNFTSNLEQAANALRIPVSAAGVAPFNPYVEIIEALKRFEGQPTGRRAMLVVSDGLDVSRGIDSASPTQSIDLQRAIEEAARQSVAVYSFYAPTVGATAGGNSVLVTYGQGSLQRLADETGGQAFFQGLGAPVSFDPFLRDLTAALSKQLALTYLSTHPNKGFHRIKIVSDRSGIEISHPAGYTR